MTAGGTRDCRARQAELIAALPVESIDTGLEKGVGVGFAGVPVRR